MNKRFITLISFGNFEIDFLEDLASDVTTVFNKPVNIIEYRFELGKFYDPLRKQYNGNDLLNEVNIFPNADALKKIGLFKVDIFIPILTYIFGQAYLNGNTGIASFYRLKNEYYGLKPDISLLRIRFSKEIIHELGHTFGLKHCHTPTCVMVSSTYVEDIDQKSNHFCAKCREEMEGNLLQ